MLKFGSPREFSSRFSTVFALMRLQRFHAGVLRALAAAHLSTMRNDAQVVEVGLAAPGRARGADFAVHIEPGAENRRVADAARNLPRQAAGRRDAADLAAGVDAVAVDRAVEVIGVDQPVVAPCSALDADASVSRACGIEIVRRIGPPLPFEPAAARSSVLRSSSILKPMLRAKLCASLPTMQVVVGVVSRHASGHERRRAHALDARHARRRAWCGPCMQRRVELHDAVGVGQAAVADARVVRIELAQVDAGDQRRRGRPSPR